MNPSYSDAAVRHFHDAELLRQADRLDAAGHLIGFAAECAIKSAVVSLRPQAEAPHLHFPALIEAAKKRLRGRQCQTLFTILNSPAFMDSWDVSMRYSATGYVTSDSYERWRSNASRLLGAAGLRNAL